MPASRSSSPALPLAAIDIGSNSFRLEIGQLEHGRYRRLDYLKETVRLGGGLDAQGRLSEAAAERGFACLRRFAARLQGFEPWQVRAVATQTLREASNRDEFLARAQTVLGLPIEVISGREEARLIYAGVSQLQPSTRKRLVIDIGGRSTEAILGQGREPIDAESFPVGSVSLSLRYFPHGQLTAQSFREAQVAAGAEIEESLAAFRSTGWSEVLGSSGTVGALSQILVAEGLTNGAITLPALRHCIERCIAAGQTDRLDFASLKPDRRPVIAGGLSILYTLCALLRIDTLMPAKGALRQGVIVELDARLQSSRDPRRVDLRDRSIVRMQQHFHGDAEHARWVEQVALSLYDAAAPELAPADARRELRWAALVHEVGMSVSHHDHHRHSAYLVAHADLAGFSQSQQRRLAALVLSQRGGLRKTEEELTDPIFAWQCLCLRLAVVACHARTHPTRPTWRIARKGGSVALRAPSGTGSGDLRTLHLLREELAHWQRMNVWTLSLVE